MFYAYIKYILGISFHILGLPFRNISCIFQAYNHVYCRKITCAALWHISGMAHVLSVILGYIVGISQHILALTQTSKCLLSHEMISLNLISFDISLLFWTLKSSQVMQVPVWLSNTLQYLDFWHERSAFQLAIGVIDWQRC